MNRKIKIAFFVLLLAALGFFRENLFVNINYILYSKLNNEIYTPVRYISFLTAFSYKTVYIAKWFITPLFAFIFWFVQKQFLTLLFNEKKITRWLSILYLSLFLLAGVFFVAGWALGDINKGYTFSRIFMGLLQSPISCMILIPTAYLYKQTNQQ